MAIGQNLGPFWYHRVCLVKARRTMYNFTLKGKGQNLTSGQVRARSLGDPSQIIHHSMRLSETNAMTAIPRLYLIWFSSYWQKTVGDLEWPPWPLEGSPTKNFTWNINKYLTWCDSINPRPAGPLDFPPPAGGGGRLNAPPWSRLLVAVEKNERQRSKAREKSFRNHFGHFFTQVKIGVSRGQNSKIFLNGFSKIKSLLLKIEQRIWYHRVCLVKARRTIYKMTLKGQGQSLTSGQVWPMSRDDRNGSYCISVDSPGQYERTDTNPTSLSLFDQKVLGNDGWWPRVTLNDFSRGRQCKFLLELSTTVLCDMIPLK